MILVDELEARWQQVISLLDSRSSSNPEDLQDSSPIEAGTLSQQSPKRSKSTPKKQRPRKRRLYTLVNEDNNLENVIGSVEKLNLSQNFSSLSLKSSKGLERALEPLQSANTYLGKVEQSMFAAEDQDLLGLTNPKRNRWSQIHKASVYSEMMFGISLPSKSRLPDGPTDIVEEVDTSKDIERVICKIQYYGSGNFSISPNFTDRETKEMHEIHIGDDTYLYTIENTSNPLSHENERKEKLIFEEFFKRQHSLRMDKLAGQMFEGMPDDSFHQRYCLNGEITSCKGFQSDTLYCQYLVDVPSEWKTDERQINLLSAHTQVAYATILQGELDRTAFFGAPIEVSLVSRGILFCSVPYLFCDSTYITIPRLQTHLDKSPRPIKIYFKVYSMDSSDRHCVEGYGYTLLPLEAGSVDFQVNTWRPLFDFREQVQSFFLGGSPDLFDLKFNNTDEVIIRYF